MIHDTDEKTLRKYEQMLASKRPGERLGMALDMYDFARDLARAGVKSRRPGATDAEIERELFLQFYGHELPQSLIDRVLRDIDERFAEGSAASAPA